jgi:hypothetical protein
MPRSARIILAVLVVLLSPRFTRAAAPRARAVQVEERVIYHPPENPGFAAWVQLWQEPSGDLSVKFLERRKPRDGERVEPPPFDAHKWEAIGLPAQYNFANLVNETVFMRSADAGASWRETARSREVELNQGADSGCMSPIALPDGRLLSLSWGMPGCLRESRDGGKTWQRLRELMDPRFYDVAPFAMRMLSDKQTLVILNAYAPSWGEGKRVPGRLHSKPGTRTAWQSALHFSTDFGKTLSPPLPIFPGVPVTEADFCELPAGDLLFIHHKMFAGPGGKAHRQLIRKTSTGWVPEAMEEIGDDAPEIFLRTKDGYLVGTSRNAPYVWSDDDGVSWYPVEGIPRGEYQPRAMLLPDDRLLFAWHKGGDLPYGQADMYIGQHTFKFEVIKPLARTQLKLSRVFDPDAKKYICAFDAALTTTDGKPVAGKPIEFSIVGRDEPGYEPFGGAMPWVRGRKQVITTDDKGVARISFPEQAAITDIHRSFQVAARFDPERTDQNYQRSTSLTIEYYAVTPTAP